jgi:hypothetical protein
VGVAIMIFVVGVVLKIVVFPVARHVITEISSVIIGVAI